ncbi:MAG: DUF2924 domain-containing protein [Proteobacteria bacterium]|nr:DUF2924 domain-containing protein [Pseudomonadota bacterium]
MTNLNKEIAILNNMTVNELRQKYSEVFGENTNARNKQYLIKKIAWRMQANIEGDLSERARRRAKELVDEAGLRVRPPKTFSVDSLPEQTSVHSVKKDSRIPGPGAVITRKYKGKMIMVTVLEEGFEFDSKKYRSLSGIAKEITGTHWNGYKFFDL